jgi:hypothetical protein
VNRWFSKRLKVKGEESVPLAVKKWTSFRKVFQSVWIAFDQVKRASTFSLRRLITAPGNHSDW